MQTWSLPTRRLGKQVLVFDEIDSTNAHAFTLAHDSENDGLVILARAQTAGRGQHGRAWLAPPESSVLLSVLLFPPPDLRRPALLTAWAAASVHKLVDELGDEPPRIKWPNDIYLRGKKICGILIEQRQAAGKTAVVAGVGLNVNQSAEFFRAADLPLGGSLLTQSGVAFAWQEMARRLIERFDDSYHDLVNGRCTSVETAWALGQNLLGKWTRAETAQGDVTGRLETLTLTSVVLSLRDGTRKTFAPEAIRHLTEESEPR